MKNLLVKLIGKEYLNEITFLTKQLNKNISLEVLTNRQIEMFTFENYKCFGLFENDKLIGVSGGWITVRLYSGRQLEIDHLIINSTLQSKGYGKKLISEIELWAKENQCETTELNAYIQNERSHKFYFNEGYKILGFHFQKVIK